MHESRRNFVKKGLMASAAFSTFTMFDKSSTLLASTSKELSMKAFPHEWMGEPTWVYLADENVDPFKSSVKFNNGSVVIDDPSALGKRRFSINALWFVEGFGNIVLDATNGGNLYSIEDFPSESNLNYEFAKSRVIRNREVKKRYEILGTKFSREVEHLVNLGEDLYNHAKQKINNSSESGLIANQALNYILWAGEKIELEHARQQIEIQKRTDKVYFGCESRQYIWAKSEDLTKRFAELFNFATITHYIWDTWYPLFEPKEGDLKFGIKDDIVGWLQDHNITIEGRPLFWFHPVVTPDWLKSKNFSQLKDYVKKHTESVVGHYGDKISSWEVVNEYHDWANIHNHTPKQISEITKLACDTVKEVNPNVKRLINNCCPWAEYAARGRYAGSKENADRPLRSPRKFMEDIINDGVDFDILGIQIYFPQRDLSDIVRLLERLDKFNKPIYLTEIGASAGYYDQAIKLGEMNIEDAPYQWHRRWDEELQADWLEEVYTLYYSRKNVKAINWYDFSDFRPFIRHGGLVREDASPKRSFDRLKELLGKWDRLPKS